MSYSNQDEEIDCKIIESYGIFSQGLRFWNKEVNLVSWNGRPAKLDIRNWQRDHERCGKGIAITREEAEELVKLLNTILRAKPRAEKARGGTSRKAESESSRKAGSSEKARPSGKPGPSKGTETSNKSEAPKREAKNVPAVPKTLEPFYRELKLPFGVEIGECKTARNALLKKYHPDVNSGNIASATRKTIKIKEAYEKIAGWWLANGLVR